MSEDGYTLPDVGYVPVLPVTRGAFLTPLDVRVLDERDPAGRELLLVLAPFVYDTRVAGRTITVPPGFVCDGESIPPAARSMAGDPSMKAGVIHDWLYACHDYGDREQADRIYREVLLTDNVDVVDADKKYGAVAWYGQGAWETGPERLRMERVG